MQLSGFGLPDYKRLLRTALDHGYEFYTVAEYLDATETAPRSIVLRHDVDRRVPNAVALADAEADLGIDATYYFRTSTFDPEIAEQMASNGHEIGYHYEDFVKERGNPHQAHTRFAANLASFRQHVPIETVCAHGNALSPHLNMDMWNEDTRTPADYDLLGRAYDIDADDDGSSDRMYLSDTGRDWDASVPEFGAVRSTDDVVQALESGDCPSVYLLAHPSRWATSGVQRLERVSWDLAAETGKSVANTVNTVRQADGRFGSPARVLRALRSIASTGIPGRK